MNKEVEDALHMLLHCSLKDTEYETQFEQYKIVRNYITNLQQENKQLKEDKKKAREYIKHSQTYGTMAQVMPHLKPYVNGDDLLKILGDKENE